MARSPIWRAHHPAGQAAARTARRARLREAAGAAALWLVIRLINSCNYFPNEFPNANDVQRTTLW